jgi:hypothetical protein
MKNKNKSAIPTVEEFSKFKPLRLDFKYSTDQEGLVILKVPKFTSKIGISLCKILKKENIFNANLDKIGSVIWNMSDGEKTVSDILKHIKLIFPNEKNIDQRLYVFLQQMKNLNYIDF